jgi:hypothetical protein
MNAMDLTDDELLQHFELATLPTTLFDHRQHVRVAWLFVTRRGMPDAIAAFSRALRQFATAKGAHNLYHVTITWAYLLLINERQQRCGAVDWPTFAAHNEDLLEWRPSILDKYYTADALWSDRARQTFVMPDRAVAS